MIIVLYMVCLLLLLPVVALSAFLLLIDSLVNFGFWEVFKLLFAPIYDPFGKGAWIFVLFVSMIGLGSAGFFPGSRPYGFGAIALIGVVCAGYIAKSYPHQFDPSSMLLFVPSFVGVALSVYLIVKPLR